jgi:hypothetical protein
MQLDRGKIIMTLAIPCSQNKNYKYSHEKYNNPVDIRNLLYDLAGTGKII